jgi:2-octaprenyl-6-methoxyphenol hydroxylase
MVTARSDYDVLIVGGGLVGASLACALGGLPVRVGVIEAFSYGSAAQPSYDDRSVALAYGARRIFTGMGLWPTIADDVTPIKKIHISDRGHFGVVRLDASTTGQEALGYVIENRHLGKAFADAMAGFANIEMICPAQLQAIEIDETHARATIKQDETTSTITTRLIVGADGGQSLVRQCVGIEATSRDYGQCAIIANVTPGKFHDHVAYERFTRYGPLAMLPLSDSRCSLVWTMDRESSKKVLEMSDGDFLARLQQFLGFRLGRLVKAGKRHIYPLALVRTQQQVRQRLVLIGNAAHTLHPVAGQGFNLGLRDVAVLAQILTESIARGDDPGELVVLEGYQKWRRGDQAAVTAFTDGIIRIFSNSFIPLVVVRNIGLVALDTIPPLKRGFLSRTMGLAGKLPRLARGLNIQPHDSIYNRPQNSS